MRMCTFSGAAGFNDGIPINDQDAPILPACTRFRGELTHGLCGACCRAARLPAARFRVAASAYDADLLGEGRSGLDTDARDIVLFDDQNKDQMLKLLTRLSENDVEYTELKVRQHQSAKCCWEKELHT